MHRTDRSCRGGAAIDVFDHRAAADVGERFAGKARRLVSGGDDGDCGDESGNRGEGPELETGGTTQSYHNCTRLPGPARASTLSRAATSRRATATRGWQLATRRPRLQPRHRRRRHLVRRSHESSRISAKALRVDHDSRRAATYLVGAVLLAAWLASAAGVTTRPQPARLSIGSRSRQARRGRGGRAVAGVAAARAARAAPSVSRVDSQSVRVRRNRTGAPAASSAARWPIRPRSSSSEPDAPNPRWLCSALPRRVPCGPR